MRKRLFVLAAAFAAIPALLPAAGSVAGGRSPPAPPDVVGK